MATVVKKLVFSFRRCPRYISPRYPPTCAIPWQRPFSSTTSQFEERSDARAEWDELLRDLRSMDSEALQKALNSSGGDLGVDMELEDEDALDIEQEERGKIGFFGEGEEELGPDDDYYGDDITALGHGELEQHRELREYARLAAWELPLLSKLTKPFEPPNKNMPLRFRYTTYMGEEHSAANKVVVEFCASDMPDLTPQQKDKLIKLAGPRYNPSTDIVKMSCEIFETQAQNKRFLGDTIYRLLKEARDERDTFADVPFDFRHHKAKAQYEFPKEWLLTPERKQYLEARRKLQLQLEAERKENGTLLDGVQLVEKMLVSQPVMAPPELVGTTPAGRRGKQRQR